jgi:Rhodopirellula transposase DDE domain
LNKIEHHLSSFITINWRDMALRTYRTIVQLIAATTTEAGQVRAELDEISEVLVGSHLVMATLMMVMSVAHQEWS